jgi:hypothetical protein
MGELGPRENGIYQEQLDLPDDPATPAAQDTAEVPAMLTVPPIAPRRWAAAMVGPV